MSRALIAGAVLGAGLVTGGLLIQSGAWREARAASASARLLDQVMAHVSQNYIDTVSTDDLNRRAAVGFVKEIDDPHSVLLTPDRYRRVRELATGRYAGIGIEIDMRDGFVTVIAPLAGTPADSAGMKPGDRILAIDDKPTHGLTMEEAQHRLRGPTGTKVKLNLERGGDHPTVWLRRREILYRPVQRADMWQGVAYVELATFSERAASDLRRTIDSVRARGARSLILDLRENPGGLLEQGIAVADLFLDPGQTIASTRGRTALADQEFEDQVPPAWPDLPVVLLVDSGTASAAEIVAGALQDNRRAVLVGSATYGKGSAQTIFPLTEGHALKITTARWFTPEGRTIERDSSTGGIMPDVVVDPGKMENGRVPAAGGRAKMQNGRTHPLSIFAVDPVVRRAMQLLDGVTTPDELRARARELTAPRP